MSKNTVMESGAYGDATLKTPGTPIDCVPTGRGSKAKPNSIVASSPGGPTFQADHPAITKIKPGTSPKSTKVITSKSGPGFKANKANANSGTSAAGAPLRVKTRYN